MSGLRLALVLVALVAAGLGLAFLTAHPPPRPLKPLLRPALETEETFTRIAIGSCADQRLAEPIWDTIRAEHPELFIFMGNAVYGDAASGDPALPELKAAYSRLSYIPGFIRFVHEIPILPIWDDHDYGRKDAGTAFPFKARSKALFLQFWNIPKSVARTSRPGLYDAQIIGPPGHRIQIILLDLRWFRDGWKRVAQPSPGRELYVPDPDPGKTLLGPQQWAWLAGELKEEAELRLIVSPIQVEAEGHGFERWGNFPLERQRLYALIAKTGAGGVVFLSGNRGAGGLYKRTEDLPYPLFEITASALNKPAAVKDLPEFDRLGPLYAKENYGLLTVDWRLKTLRLELKSLKGETVMAASVPLAALKPAPQAPNLVRQELP
jgi:alkaline phosphatase D